jgi:hypothetical protein
MVEPVRVARQARQAGLPQVPQIRVQLAGVESGEEAGVGRRVHLDDPVNELPLRHVGCPCAVAGPLRREPVR